MVDYSHKINMLWQGILSSGAKTLAADRLAPTAPLDIVAQLPERFSDHRELVLGQIHFMLVKMREHFPENIFWDVDALIYSSIVNCCEDNFEAALVERISLVADVMEIFGLKGAIRFQYFHDFTLGFDYIKWLGKVMPTRPLLSDPFSLEFMSYMRQRGYEMLQTIARDGVKYPKIPEGQFRNSYPFVRTPEREYTGCVRLRDSGLIPLAVWLRSAHIVGSPDWVEKRNDLLA